MSEGLIAKSIRLAGNERRIIEEVERLRREGVFEEVERMRRDGVLENAERLNYTVHRILYPHNTRSAANVPTQSPASQDRNEQLSEQDINEQLIEQLNSEGRRQNRKWVQYWSDRNLYQSTKKRWAFSMSKNPPDWRQWRQRKQVGIFDLASLALNVDCVEAERISKTAHDELSENEQLFTFEYCGLLKHLGSAAHNGDIETTENPLKEILISSFVKWSKAVGRELPEGFPSGELLDKKQSIEVFSGKSKPSAIKLIRSLRRLNKESGKFDPRGVDLKLYLEDLLISKYQQKPIASEVLNDLSRCGIPESDEISEATIRRIFSKLDI